ncbi:pectate lyase family protein [Mesonia aestuariivivens]|uniref:Pectate lyase n=1 Tax=Mesonia aestuariivivens TaxID=2796128 RepID=A0ABS6W439_9FLAO|nr:hypothetical protein [Mesonia aestuariivivens]MBW2962626.1 hypothetical protein [Mesonia aestuariivivens]
MSKLNCIIFLFSFLFVSCITDDFFPGGGNNDACSEDQVLAFPTAQGFGKYASGARSVAHPEVYKVTNLNDSGQGSFRDAVSKSGRFVLFEVSGIINLQSPVSIANNLTIAGQTAPGDGIVLYGQKVSFTGANHTIARYLRIRLGNTSGISKNTDASGIANGKNIILDHFSVSWGLDEVFSINWDKKGFEPDSITIQNSIIAQGLHRHNHSAGGLIQSENGHISILNSLYASNKTRNPKVKGKSEYVNNIVYNYGNKDNPMGHTVSGAAYIMGGSAMVSEVNIINNYFISGPLTLDNEETPFSRGTETFNVYASGNYFDNNKNGILDGNLVPEDTLGYPGLLPANLKSSPYPYPEMNTFLSASQAYNYVKNNAGANYPSQDEVDELIMAELDSKGTQGIYVYTESDLSLSNNGLGNYESTNSPTDSDQDGIPDIWENQLGLNPNDATDALEVSSICENYLNIEMYINGLVDL